MSPIVKYGGGFIAICIALPILFGDKKDTTRPAVEPSAPRPTTTVPAPDPGPPPKSLVRLVGSRDLIKAYSKNEVAADKEYGGHMLRVAGKIRDIGKDITGDPYVTVGEMFKGVNCYFSEDHADEIAQLSKGSPIVFEGKCSGLTVGSVILRDCQIVSDAQLAVDNPEAAKQMAAERKKRRHSADDDDE